MTYDDFKKKWFWRYLYETPGLRQLAGKIECHREENTPSPNYPFEPVTLDLIEIPTWHGFKDDKQRRQFYREAKKVGLRRWPKKKNTWYKIIY